MKDERVSMKLPFHFIIAAFIPHPYSLTPFTKEGRRYEKTF
jgi:hypothetical protein